MVHRLVVSYGPPEDPAAFDAHYRDVHAPLAKQLPGLVRFTTGHASPMDPSQPAPYLVAELDFDSEAAMGAAFASPEGQAAAADVPGFATGGATMAHFEVQTVAGA
ncbi:EthD family reductase [Blastococcus sp. TBT05-19]|uniref:EthD family reductase n=1 Tax=Blastococcus sp. TBT05-19 TaxID=2250581 RepID=UPI000DEB8960|nr:EthD family reductase [Blastococcus sp. TBT05-19]RBY94434.1 EthD family reductase [Blastococcus sp. TBT05-19]